MRDRGKATDRESSRLWETDPMYTPASFAEDDIEVMHAFVRQHPLAALVTCSANELEATHVPVVLHPDLGSKGALRCHLARANDQWRAIKSSSAVLMIFQGANHYITPSWYPSTQEHGKVVPTWNYVAVHIRGQARILEDQRELIEHLKALTEQNEHGYKEPWSIADAPEGFIEAMSQAVVGIEISIHAIEGKWKASQNRPAPDAQGVVAGLTGIDSPASLEMAQIVRQRCLRQA